MKRIAFVVSWLYKTFTPTTILVSIFHMCTCDDVALINEQSIVSWKYMKSNKKCVFNVNVQYNHKQVPTTYFSMMFNIHKHINLCVGTRVWRVWNLQSKNNCKVDFSSPAIFYWPFSSVIDRNRNRPLISSKIKLVIVVVLQREYNLNNFYETVLTLNKFWRWFTDDLIVHWVRRVFFLIPQWNFMCYYAKVCLNIIPIIHKNYRKQNKQPTRKLVRHIILEINSLDM